MAIGDYLPFTGLGRATRKITRKNIRDEPISLIDRVKVGLHGIYSLVTIASAFGFISLMSNNYMKETKRQVVETSDEAYAVFFLNTPCRADINLDGVVSEEERENMWGKIRRLEESEEYRKLQGEAKAMGEGIRLVTYKELKEAEKRYIERNKKKD